jgi:hypothetical protein
MGGGKRGGWFVGGRWCVHRCKTKAISGCADLVLCAMGDTKTQAAERELRALGEEISQMEAKKQEVGALVAALYMLALLWLVTGKDLPFFGPESAAD